jgi:hypothetical protein
VFGGEAPQSWFIYYEHGGIALHYHLIVYKAGSQEPAFAGRFVTQVRGDKLERPPSSIRQLKEWFNSGRVRDDAIKNNDW